jgi:class 3 adenylate cyclase/tetratricopeptide (TPR) repeat protein
VKRKIAAIMVADVVGYSRLVAEDEEEALSRLAAYRAVFNDFVVRFNGRIFNTAGDAVLAEFPSAVDAVRCGVDLQESLRARNLAYPASRQMSYRIGITIGDIVERDGDLLGDGINIASRLESMAPVGGICISRSVYEAVSNKLSVKFSDIGPTHLKNIPNPVHAYTIMLHADETAQPAPVPVRSVLSLHWTATAALVIAAASLGGFVLNWVGHGHAPREAPEDASAVKTEIAEPQTADLKLTGTQPPVAMKVAAPKPVEGNLQSPPIAVYKPPPLPDSDPIVRETLIKKQWMNCLEGTEPKPTIAACRAVIDYKISSGDKLALIHQKLGRAQRQDEDSTHAIDSYSEAIRLNPSAELYNDRGIAYFDNREWERAIDDYSQAIRLNPNFGEAYNNRAWTQVTSGHADRALKDANMAVELLPAKSYAWDTRGHIHEALGDRAAAIRDYRKALELDPKNSGSEQALKRLKAFR